MWRLMEGREGRKEKEKEAGGSFNVQFPDSRHIAQNLRACNNCTYTHIYPNLNTLLVNSNLIINYLECP